MKSFVGLPVVPPITMLPECVQGIRDCSQRELAKVGVGGRKILEMRLCFFAESKWLT